MEKEEGGVRHDVAVSMVGADTGGDAGAEIRVSALRQGIRTKRMTGRPKSQCQRIKLNNRAKSIQTNLNLNQTRPNFILSIQDLPDIEHFEIKYGCEGLERRNHCLHRNFFRFEMEIESKIYEVKVCF
jgi:hypothetical protein